MSQLMFTIRRLLAGPLSVISAPFSALSETFAQSERGRMFVLSLPALCMFVTGLVLLAASQIGREQRLVQRYDELAKRAHLEGDALVEDFLKASRLLEIEKLKVKGGSADQNPGSSAAGRDSTASESAIPDGGSGGAGNERLRERQKRFDELLAQLVARRSEEQLHLQKLISLKPEQQEYRFRYAKSKLPLEEEFAVGLIRQMAPLDASETVRSAIGYGPAHSWMAQHLAKRQPASEHELKAILLDIDKHATRALAVDPSDQVALQLRAQSLIFRGELGRAVEDYQRLFESDPGFFIQLVSLNERLNRSELNADLLERAAGRLQRELTLNREDTAKWENRWAQYAACMMQRKQFNELRRELESHRKDLARSDPRWQFLGTILSGAFSQRMNELLGRIATSPVDAEEAIQIIEAARDADAVTDPMKYAASALARNVPSLRARALAVYDPSKDPDPPAQVLSDLAIDALSQKDYGNAIRILERARVKQPRSPVILNNLAFAYLSAETTDPERALDLVSQAIREFSQLNLPEAESRQQLSRYLHTRGTALLQLNRPDDARAAFLEALAGRPDNETILESLLKTYEGRDDDQADAIRRRLEQIRAAAQPGGAAATPAGSEPPR